MAIGWIWAIGMVIVPEFQARRLNLLYYDTSTNKTKE